MEVKNNRKKLPRKDPELRDRALEESRKTPKLGWMNEQIKAKSEEISKLTERYLENSLLVPDTENPEKISVEDFKKLYNGVQSFFAILDADLDHMRGISFKNYDRFAHGLAQDLHVQAAEYDGKLGIILPLPHRIFDDSYPKAQFPHTSIPRVLLRNCLNFVKETPLYHRPYSIYFLFNYHNKIYVRDHDNLQVSGWIDEIAQALDMDDNGLVCRTHYASVVETRLDPRHTYICVTHRDAQPMTPEQIIEFFLVHFA